MNAAPGQRSTRYLTITRALPQAAVVRKRVESTTSTNGVWAARASDVDVPYSRKSGTGSVVTARATPPASASVGVWTAGAGWPRATVAPGSLTATSTLPARARPPVVAVTANRHQPG